MRTILKYCLEVLSGSDPPYPFSKEKDRNEIYREIEPGLAAVILQESLSKIKLLASDYDRLLRKGGTQLVSGKPSGLLKAQLTGFFQDMIENVSSMDPVVEASRIESLLYDHAKWQHISIPEALKALEDVDNMVFQYTFKTSVSRVKYVRESSEVLQALRKNQGLILIPY